MEEKNDLFNSTVPEESSDYFVESPGEVTAGLQTEPESADPAQAADPSVSAGEEAALENEGLAPGSEPGEAETDAERIAREEALKAQEEAERKAREAAALKAQEEAAEREREAALQAQKEAQQQKLREETERRVKEEAERRAQERAQKEAVRKAKKEERKKAREARREAIRNWVPGPQFPNILTIARICMIPLIVIFILWVPKPAGNILSMILFIIASLTDTADGYIARKYNYVSTFGKFMDPLADKLLVCSVMICLVDLGRLESWIVIIIIAREFIISGFRLIAVEKGVVIAANIWGKVKTVIQMLMVILMLGNFDGFLGVLTQIFKWAALLLTLISLASYLIQNRRVLKDEVNEVEVEEAEFQQNR